MEKYPALFFLIRFLTGSVLLYLNISKQKKEYLLEVFKLSFLAIGIIVLANYLLSLRPGVVHEGRFYDVNFTDFVIVTLFVNLIYRKKKTTEAN